RVRNDRTKRIDRHEVASIGGNRAVEVSGNQKHEIGGSVNTVVGGTGPMAMLAMAGVQALSGQTAGLLAQAAQIAGGGGPGIASFATTLASSALGFLGAGGLSAREGVVSGPSPRADAGTALAGSGTGVGSDASSLFPLPGIMNTIVSSFKSDSVGIARAEQIGVSKVTNVGRTSFEHVGKAKNTTVGEEYVIEVGDRMLVNVGRELKITVGKSVLVMDRDGNVSIFGTNFDFSASGPVKINGQVIDLNK
ncbi:hypothetical protein GGQ71_004983, partial [Rhizobium taibaishanense]|nr:hypothetical protein [Allorhizobium taibaishanense]